MRRLYVSGSIPLTQAIDHRSLILLDTAPRPFRDPAFGWEVPQALLLRADEVIQ